MAEGDASELAFFVVEDFFAGDGDASAVEALFFFVVDVAVVPDFFVVDDCFVAAVLEVAVVSFLFAQALMKASAAKSAMTDRTDFFIGWLNGAPEWSVARPIASI